LDGQPVLEAVFKHDSPALYRRHIVGLQIRSLNVEFFPPISSAVESEDIARFTLDSFRGRQSLGFAESPVISL
jgi:hypothetical protein